jgi:hypothetical protein
MTDADREALAFESECVRIVREGIRFDFPNLNRTDVEFQSVSLLGWAPDTTLVVQLTARGTERRVVLPVWNDREWEAWRQLDGLGLQEARGPASVLYVNLEETILNDDWHE